MRGRSIGCVLAVCLASGSAAAGDKNGAEAAFLQAKDLLKQGKYPAACAAFEQSQSLDPQFGTQYNLALCYELEGHLASAWGVFRELAQRDSNAGRKADSQRRADALAPRLTRLDIVAHAKPPGLKITRNGEDVTGSLGLDVPVDPGAYTVAATAPGRVTWSHDATVTQEGQRVVVDVPELAPDGTVPAGSTDAGAGDASAAPSIGDESTIAAGDKQVRAIIDRPRTLPAGELEGDLTVDVHTDNSTGVIEKHATPGAAVGYGITNAVDIHVSIAHDLDWMASGDLGVTLTRARPCSIAAHVAGGWDFDASGAATIHGGFNVQCPITPKIALFVPSYQIYSSQYGDAPPTYLSLQLGIAVQPSPAVYLSAVTVIAALGLHNVDSTFIFNDYTVLELHAFYSVSSHLDVGGTLGFLDLAHASDTLYASVGLRGFL